MFGWLQGYTDRLRQKRTHLPLEGIVSWRRIKELFLDALQSRTISLLQVSLTPEGEVIAAYGAAMVASFQVLINCLEESDALLPGQFTDALGV
jgi:hypothetical protein